MLLFTIPRGSADSPIITASAEAPSPADGSDAVTVILEISDAFF